MVKFILTTLLSLLVSTPVWALLNQTSLDLAVLKDALQKESEENAQWAGDLSPVLVAPPQYLWQESKDDFDANVMTVLRSVWAGKGALIPCAECDLQRMRVTKDQQVHMSTGPATTQDLATLIADPRYSSAKGIVYVKETASGVELRIIRITDGAILWQTLANGSVNLETVKPRLHLVDELERRKRGEALAYTFIELGFYPRSLVHVSFLEQWGSGNQHLTGVTISFVGPTLALGVNYRYLIPANPKVQVGGTLFLPIQNALDANSSKSTGTNSRFVVGGTAQYAFSPTFGVFGYALTDGTISAGVSFYNPIWFPFML